jgi:hypothetical protein
MKVSLALGTRRPLSRQTAWGCLTTNLALPGFGSLAAGRFSGYFQVALALLGLTLSSVFAARFFAWYVSHRADLQNELDPVASLSAVWAQVRWPLLGIGVFFLGWVWSLVTSCQIVREAKAAERHNVPPRL